VNVVVEPGRNAESAVNYQIGIVWFRNDLRLTDHRPLQAALAQHDRLIFVYLHDRANDQVLDAGFRRMGIPRRWVLADTLAGLNSALMAQGQYLWIQAGDPPQVIAALATLWRSAAVYCEEIAAPFEAQHIAELKALGTSAGFSVKTCWQSSLLEPQDLPFALEDLPQVFSNFRKRIEATGVTPRPPLPSPTTLPSLPPDGESLLINSGWLSAKVDNVRNLLALPTAQPMTEPRSSFPFFEPAFAGGERAGLARVETYFGGVLPQSYKQTRNRLWGTDYSTKFAPWLASGAVSPRSVWRALREHESRYGANESTYWIGFELWWRDYFRFLHLQHGRRLYRARGLSNSSLSPSSPTIFQQLIFDNWSQGKTGQEFIDAGMRELALTGYLSNRLRQNVASFWVNDLRGDWRIGAAWFEHCLVDYDVYSNQGNWLYLAGYGTDPRSGRRFDPIKQAKDYDIDKTYRRLWLE